MIRSHVALDFIFGGKRGDGVYNHNVYLARRWLVLINAKALEIQNARAAIWRDRSTSERRRLPDWVLEALEMLGTYAREAVEESASARRHLDEDNWEALEIEVSRCLALGLLMEGYLLAGPPPASNGDDVLDQVKEIVETLEE